MAMKSALRLRSCLQTVTRNMERFYGTAVSQRPETSQSAKMTDMGTRKIFSEEHDIVRTSIRKFMQEEVVPNYDRYEAQGQVDRELWEKAGANGFLGMAVAEEHGGIGSDILTSSIFQDEMMYANAPGLLGMPFHSDCIMQYISLYGSPEQRAKYLPRMTAGTCIGALAMTEPSAGSDLQGVRTRAKRDGDDWILNGSKVFISNGILCDVVIVVTVTDPEAKSAAHGISLFLVDSDKAGFTKGKNLKKLGVKASDTAELFFDNVRLPADALLGKENHGFVYLMQELPKERLGVGYCGVAASEFMFEETRNYVKERKAFGKTLSKLQTIQHNLAEMKTEICIARTFVDNCLVLLANGQLDAQMASMAKYWCTDVQNKVADRCLQLHGGWGYMMEYPIARAYADSRLQPIYGGTNEIMKELISRSIV